MTDTQGERGEVEGGTQRREQCCDRQTEREGEGGGAVEGIIL